MAAGRTILAVAVGNSASSSPSKIIRDNNPGTFTGVRPYISGMKDSLLTFGFQIASEPSGGGKGDPNQYVIDYRQCREDELSHNFTVTPDLPTSFVLLAMSKTVADAAVTNSVTAPVVAMVSSHPNYPDNFTGVSAQRHQKAREYYDHFLDTVPSLRSGGRSLYLLHKENYYPSEQSIQNIKHLSRSVPDIPIPVHSPYGDKEIQTAINSIPRAPGGGLLILPVDYFFAAAPNIISWAHARGLPDFWPVTDWVQSTSPSAVGGRGASQYRCGQLLGDQIQRIWTNPPNIPEWTDMQKETNFLWVASRAGATGAGVALGNPDGLTTL